MQAGTLAVQQPHNDIAAKTAKSSHRFYAMFQHQNADTFQVDWQSKNAYCGGCTNCAELLSDQHCEEEMRFVFCDVRRCERVVGGVDGFCFRLGILAIHFSAS